MKTSDHGVAFIAAHEGIVTRAYRDVAGVWTIGVGHTAAAGPPLPTAGMRITREAAMRILANDLPKYERRVEKALGGVPETVFDGAVSFDFNTGAIHRASWVREYREGRPAEARRALLRWMRAGGRVVAGLVRRREAEARLIFGGDYGSGSAVGGGSAASNAEVREYQSELAVLGFYKGAVDGIAGEKTRAAVIAYQQSHPDLVVDGIAGPATRASLARDLAARRRAAEATAAAVTSAIAAGAGATQGGAELPLLWAALAGIGVAALLGAVIAVRYRGEVRRFFSRQERMK